MNKYYQKNKIKILEQQKEYRKKNPEKLKDAHKKWCLENKERYKKYRQEYYLKNKNEIIRKSLKWREKNREKIRERDRKKYKEKVGMLKREKGIVWKTQRQKALERDNYTCQMCGSKTRIEVHHIDGNGSSKKAKKQNNKLSNLICFCHQCHIRVEILKVGNFGGKYKRDIIRDKKIFRLSKKFSQVKIAKLEGLTRQRVSQIIQREKRKVSKT